MEKEWKDKKIEKNKGSVRDEAIKLPNKNKIEISGYVFDTS